MPNPTPPVIQAAEAYRAQLERKEAAAFRRLIDAYQRSYARLQDKIDLLIMQIGEQQPTRGQIVRLERYRELMAQVSTELTGLQTLTTDQVGLVTDEAINAAIRQTPELLSYAATGGPEIAARFNTLPKEAIKQLLGFLTPDGELYKRLALIAPYNTQQVADAIVSGAALGYNPRKIAAQIQRAYGASLTDGLRFVRTSQMYAYREASRAGYIANADVVDGWIWHAHLGDTRTCMSCIAMHGTEHPLDEPLNDHHAGRCAQIPMVKGYSNPVTQTGEQWFSEQSEVRQRELMGKGKFQAWQDGKFSFDALSTDSLDDVYGVMRVETPLKELIPSD